LDNTRYEFVKKPNGTMKAKSDGQISLSLDLEAFGADVKGLWGG
jgi:hypothetical protein